MRKAIPIFYAVTLLFTAALMHPAQAQLGGLKKKLEKSAQDAATKFAIPKNSQPCF